jgi:tetratricopeptide (TPR) repeat protein
MFNLNFFKNINPSILKISINSILETNLKLNFFFKCNSKFFSSKKKGKASPFKKQEEPKKQNVKELPDKFKDFEPEKLLSSLYGMKQTETVRNRLGGIPKSQTETKPLTKKIMSDLDKQAFQEEINHLLEKEEYETAQVKLNTMISYLKGFSDDESVEKICDYVLLVSDIYHLFERSIDGVHKLREVYINLKDIDTEQSYMSKTKILDRLSYENLVTENMEESLRYSTELVDLVRDRIAQDKLSVMHDKSYLVATLLNHVNVKLEAGFPKQDLFDHLKEAYELFHENKSYMEELAFKLLKAYGLVTYEMDLYEEALKYLKEALKYKEMEADEESEECFAIYKCMADIYVELGENELAKEYYEKSKIVKQDFINSLNTQELLEEGQEHFIELARIFESLADFYFEEEIDLQKCEENIKAALENYLRYPLESIYLSRCYYLLSEINLEIGEWDKCIEYSKMYIKSIDKFIEGYKNEMKEKNFDLELFTRFSISSHENFVFRCYKNLSEAYGSVKDIANMTKYTQLAIDKLLEINSENNEEEHEEINEDEKLNDFINMKYQLMKLYENMGNQVMVVKECDELIAKLTKIDNENITITDCIDDNENNIINKYYFIIDALFNKVDYFINNDKFSEAKRLLSQIKEIIHKNNLQIEKEREEELDKKLNLVLLKLRHEKLKK